MTESTTNRERVLECIRNHPDGIDDDQISDETGVEPRQQVYQIASRLANEGFTRRVSVVKPGKRKKIHNFPVADSEKPQDHLRGKTDRRMPSWKKRLAVLVAATGQEEEAILDKALEGYARDLLQREFE